MEWTELKDWKVMSGIATFIAGIVAFLLKRPRETAETIQIKAQAALNLAEAKKINRELDDAQEKMIMDLRHQLDDAHELSRQLQRKLDRLTVRLNVWETFGASLKKTKNDD